MTFSVIVDPSDAELATLAANVPTNPFCCTRYAAARRAGGATVVLFHDTSACDGSSTTIGYLRGHAISRTLEITSAPALTTDCKFWDGVLDFCRRHHIAAVEIDSYGSRNVVLPAWSAPASLRERTEWILQLEHFEALTVASNHKRNINKARKIGVTTTFTTDPSATDDHVRLMAASMHRRAARGEVVPTVSARDTTYERALLASGAARIYQAWHGDDVLSSLMVLVCAGGAYYQSAGTSPEGMEIGASTLLVAEAIRDLAKDGKTVFNLGGAGPESEGLRRFKAGFGAEPVTLTACTYQIASPIHRTLRKAIRLIRRPATLRTSLARRWAALFAVIAAGTLR